MCSLAFLHARFPSCFLFLFVSAVPLISFFLIMYFYLVPVLPILIFVHTTPQQTCSSHNRPCLSALLSLLLFILCIVFVLLFSCGCPLLKNWYYTLFSPWDVIYYSRFQYHIPFLVFSPLLLLLLLLPCLDDASCLRDFIVLFLPRRCRLHF